MSITFVKIEITANDYCVTLRSDKGVMLQEISNRTATGSKIVSTNFDTVTDGSEELFHEIDNFALYSIMKALGNQ
jgi:hypothetical protein